MSDLVAQHERRIKRAFFYAFALCVLAIAPCSISFISSLKPPSEKIDLWFQRSGAAMTAFSVFSQVKVNNILEMIRGGTFAESWKMYHKYIVLQRLASGISVILIISGTVIWGYGDLLLRYFLCCFAVGLESISCAF